MDDKLILTLAAAFFCVISRAILSCIDRRLFQNNNIPFLSGVTLNAIYPLLACVLFVACAGKLTLRVYDLMQLPGVILSGFGAQITAYTFSLSFRHMQVRPTTVSAKISDLFIPLCVFAISRRFSMAEYLFSSATTFAFAPLLWNIIKGKEEFSLKHSFILIASLVFQAGINSYFEISKLGSTWGDFLQLMVAILVWRFLFISALSLISYYRNYEGSKQKCPPISLYYHVVFAGRGLLAFISQATFFLGIVMGENTIAWPILNTGPLMTCIAASVLLKEKISLVEYKVSMVFFFLTILYIILRTKALI